MRKYRPRLRSRHPSHSNLRHKKSMLGYFPFKSLIRLGSLTKLSRDFDVEINSIEAISNSSNKFKMKCRFTEDSVATADWWMSCNFSLGFITNPVTKESILIDEIPFPIIAKKFFGSRNNGNTKINSLSELTSYISSNNSDNFLLEKYYNYNKEYRLHVTSEGCFYSCRKVLRNGTPDQHKWYRNNKHCNWIREDGSNSELYDKPSNWDEVVLESVKSLNAVGLDIGAVDLRIQKSTDSNGSAIRNPKFIVVEINSAPSFGDYTEKKYLEEIPKVLNRKFNEI